MKEYILKLDKNETFDSFSFASMNRFSYSLFIYISYYLKNKFNTQQIFIRRKICFQTLSTLLNNNSRTLDFFSGSGLCLSNKTRAFVIKIDIRIEEILAKRVIF